MKRIQTHDAHETQNPGNGHNATIRTQLRDGADSMLRDIAFVLKMTQRVRDEINSEKEANELALV